MSFSAFFDLEGPLSPQDNAYEVLGLCENGKRIFEVISRYDDILTLEEREGYEPGDTLKLIAPFLIYHGITEEDIRRVSKRAKIVKGAGKVVRELERRGWGVRIISTSYEQHACAIGAKVGVSHENIACTRFPLDEYAASLGREDVSLIASMERQIIQDFPRLGEEEVVKRLDDFFFKELPKAPLGKVFAAIRVVGGQRKVEAMLGFIRRDGVGTRESLAVGDSITDYKMLRAVSRGGGLAVAFNGNGYSIPYADVGIASENMEPLLLFADAFEKRGREGAMAMASRMEEENPCISILADAEDEKLRRVIKIHGEYRKRVRGEAGKLG